MPGESNQLSLQVIYHGRVQGVGFRYTTHRIAGKFQVVGDVRNLADGTVEVRVCGSTNEFRSFLDEIAHTLSGNITESDESSIEAESWPDFRIRY